MSEVLKKAMAGRGNKVPVKKLVQRGGTSFQQTFWVSPAEAAALQKAGKAKPEQKKISRKELLAATTAKKKREKAERTALRTRDLFAKKKIVEARKSLEAQFLDTRLQPRRSNKSTAIQPREDMPSGLLGHYRDDGSIHIDHNTVERAREFVEIFDGIDKEFFAEEMKKWSSATRENFLFRQKHGWYKAKEMEREWSGKTAFDVTKRGEFGLPATEMPKDHPINRMMDDATDYSVFVHEVLHGFGPERGDGARSGAGVVVEELTTEIMARAHLQETLGFSPTMLTHPEFGHYNEWVIPFRSAVEDVYKISTEEAFKMLATASKKFKRAKQRIEDRHSMARVFLSGFPTPASVTDERFAEEHRDTLARKLNALAPSVFGL